MDNLCGLYGHDTTHKFEKWLFQIVCKFVNIVKFANSLQNKLYLERNVTQFHY